MREETINAIKEIVCARKLRTKILLIVTAESNSIATSAANLRLHLFAFLAFGTYAPFMIKFYDRYKSRTNIIVYINAYKIIIYSRHFCKHYTIRYVILK